MNRDGLPSLSPFGRKIVPLSIEESNGSERIIPRGTTLPDLIRIIYKANNVMPLNARFGFLDRDNKVRKYNPSKDDKFVFSSSNNVESFKKEALILIDIMNKEWQKMGLPLKKDAVRGIQVPDSSDVMSALSADHPMHETVIKNWRDISFILSNVDIMKKACVVRCVIPGWWTASYAGKDSNDIKYFDSAFRLLNKVVSHILKTSKFKTVLEETRSSMGDPLDTGVGYPFFTGAVDPSGNPLSKIASVKLYSGIGTQGFNWAKVLQEVDSRCPVPGLKGYPFAIAPIRRSQYGYKPAPCFNHRSTGLVSSHSEYGSNTTRIAWMASYPLNLYMSPIQAVMKSLRKLIPGLYHDGETVTNRHKWMSSGSVYMAEADYTNYDRFMPIDVVKKIMITITSSFAHASYWQSMVTFLHEGIPMIWPDYIPGYSSRGYVFTPERIGLLSGVKITSDIGSFVNLIVTTEALIRSKVISESQLFSYLTAYADGKPLGSQFELFHIQSDDLLLISKNPGDLLKMGKAFKESALAAGLKSSFELGDRFLMRHCGGGRNLPVASRVWQNTLSNEEPYDDKTKFIVGIAMRTDGLLGHKTVNPFGGQSTIPMTQLEIALTLSILQSIRSFISTSSVIVTEALEIIDVLIVAASVMKRVQGPAVMDSKFTAKLDILRHRALRKLADEELTKLKGHVGDASMTEALLYKLHKDSNIPSQKLLLDMLIKENGSYQTLLDQIQSRESTFYKYALSKLNIDITDL